MTTIETCGYFGWDLEAGPFTSEGEAMAYYDAHVRHFWPGDKARIIGPNGPISATCDSAMMRNAKYSRA